MEKEELDILQKAFRDNYWRAKDIGVERYNAGHLAAAATVIDYIRGDVNLPNPAEDKGAGHPPTDNKDPNELATETMKRLGSLGIQSLDEIKGFKYDSDGHFLLFVNGRFADTGWERGSDSIYSFATIIKDFGIVIQDMS